MCSDLAIAAQGLGKAYWLYPTPQHRLRQAVQPRLARALRRYVGRTATQLRAGTGGAIALDLPQPTTS